MACRTGSSAQLLSRLTRNIKTRAIATEVASLPASATLGWLRVSAKPLKQTLATWASKWVFLFTKYLQDKVGLGFPWVWGPIQWCPAACLANCCSSKTPVRAIKSPKNPVPQVTGSVAELSAFMDTADATLSRRVLGEGEPEAAEGVAPPAGGAWRPASARQT